jgi:hypothetical protein
VPALPVTEIPHVPVAFVPVVDGAPIELYDNVLAAEPSKVVPELSPAPKLLKVNAFVTLDAVVAVAAFPPILRLDTAVVLETVKGAVPVVTVDVMTPEADKVVKAPVEPLIVVPVILPPVMETLLAF